MSGGVAVTRATLVSIPAARHFTEEFCTRRVGMHYAAKPAIYIPYNNSYAHLGSYGATECNVSMVAGVEEPIITL